jgi:hypothetical protein
VLLIAEELVMNEISARPANGRYPHPSDECAAAAKFRVSNVSPFGRKLFAEAGVRSVIFARRNRRALARSLYQ